MFLGLGSNQSKDTRTVIKMGVVVIHDFHPAPIDALEAKIDIRIRKRIEPELGFGLAHFGNTVVFASRTIVLFWGIKDTVITDILFLRTVPRR
jgi:hypothetical protein